MNSVNAGMFEMVVKSKWTAEENTMEGFLSKEEKLRALAQGRAEGKAEGIAEGKAEGKAEGRAESICYLMHNMNLSFEDAAKTIGIPEDQWDSVRLLVDNLSQNIAS